MSERCFREEELFDEILDTLRAMPERLRDTFIASHYRGLTNAEIAEETGASPSEVVVLVNQANRFFYGRLGTSRPRERDLPVPA